MFASAPALSRSCDSFSSIGMYWNCLTLLAEEKMRSQVPLIWALLGAEGDASRTEIAAMTAGGIGGRRLRRAGGAARRGWTVDASAHRRRAPRISPGRLV